MSVTYDFRGRVALVTGVSRRIGIGFAIASHLARSGAGVFVHSFAPYDREMYATDTHEVAEIVTALRAYGGHVEQIEADFRDPEAPAQVVEAAFVAFGQVDILICNHAYSTMGALENLTATQIDTHLDANVRGSLLLAKEWAARHDDARPGGRVILMTSGQHLGPMPGELAYIASKAALHGLTQSLAAHLAPRHITVNTVNPGATDTGYATPALHQAVLAHEPQGRWGQPEDAACLITWLVSNDAQWVTGQVINSTGGGL